MSYNVLSGTVVANRHKFLEPTEDLSSNYLYGDGINLTNVARVVAGGTNDYVVTVGTQAQSLVGEQNLRFNGNRLYVVGDVTASCMNLYGLSSGTATSNSYLALDSSGNVVLTSSVAEISIGQGEIGSLQFHIGSGEISGSDNLKLVGGSELYLTGNLIVSGNIQAHTFDIISTTLTEFNSSGSTYFGDSNDDEHIRTGSLSVLSSSTEMFSVNSIEKTTKINTGIIFNRVAVNTDYTILKENYIIGVDSTSGQIVITLPDASILQNGQAFVIKDEGGSAWDNNITIVASGSQKINGTNTAILEVPYSSINVYCNGSNNFFTY